MSRRARRIETNRRAVSETLGYILVFSLVISTIGTVMIFGFSGLEDRQSVEQVNNVERAFDVLADNFDDMRRYEDPSRATEIRLAGGTLSLGEKVNITVGQGSNGVIDGNQTRVRLEPLIYESDGGIVVYEAGMVFRSDSERSLSRTETPIVLGESAAVVPITKTEPDGETTGITSEQTILVEGTRTEPESIDSRTIEADGEELWIEIDSPRADAWERQLTNDGFEEVSRDGDQVTARLAGEHNGHQRAPTKVTLRETPIGIEFRR